MSRRCPWGEAGRAKPGLRAITTTGRLHPPLKPQLFYLDSDSEHSNSYRASRRATASTYSTGTNRQPAS